MTQKKVVCKSVRGKSPKNAQFKLKNGLPVQLIPSTKSPVVSVQMWVNTGSADERRAEEGISHFIEHLLFKGTRNFKMGEIARTVEASGGELNAWTSFDQTVFYVNISKQFAKTALDVISDMMGFPLFDKDEIDAEREVVLEEIKRTNDNPSRKGSRLLFSTVYKKHPYRLPVIGRPEVVKSVKSSVLKKYFKERYSAKNMVLVVAGDFEPGVMRQEIQRRFSDLPGGRIRKVSRAIEPKKKTAQKFGSIVLKKADVKATQLFFSWPIPKAKSKEIAAIETLAAVFGGNASSRLIRRLRIESDCVNAIGAGCFTAKDEGFFSISSQLNHQRLDEALEKILEELVGLVAKEFEPQDIYRAVVGIESDELYGLETAEGLARKAGSLTTLLGDPSAYKEYLKKVRGFSSETARQTALKYLSPEKISISALIPEEEDAALVERKLKEFSVELQSRWLEARKELARAKKARTRTRTKPPIQKTKKTSNKSGPWKSIEEGNAVIERRTLKSGLKVIARITHSTPVVSAQLAFMGGSRIEPAGKAGLTELLSRTWTSGTSRYKETELIDIVESEAASLSAFGGRHTSGLSSGMLSRSEKTMTELFAQSLLTPVFDEAVVSREKTMMQESLRMRADKPGVIAGRLFMETMFAGHPYSVDPLGTPESMAGIKAKDLVEYQKKMICPGEGVFVLTGDGDLDAWCASIEKATMPFRDVKTGFQKHVFSYSANEDQRRFQEIKKEQTTILLGWPGITIDDPRRYALQIAQAVLGGQGGRLFLELRDKKSLAYSVGPTSMEGVDAGYVGASIECSPEKGELAISMLKEEFEKLRDNELTQEELERAQRYLIGSHDLGLQRASSIASAILFSEVYGIPTEQVFAYADKLREVRPRDIQNLLREILSKPSILVAVGPKAPW